MISAWNCVGPPDREVRVPNFAYFCFGDSTIAAHCYYPYPQARTATAPTTISFSSPSQTQMASTRSIYRLFTVVLFQRLPWAALWRLAWLVSWPLISMKWPSCPGVGSHMQACILLLVPQGQFDDPWIFSTHIHSLWDATFALVSPSIQLSAATCYAQDYLIRQFRASLYFGFLRAVCDGLHLLSEDLSLVRSL